MEYKVKYEIDVNADTPEEAALEVEDILRNRNYRPCLAVTSPDGTITDVDLETLEVKDEDMPKTKRCENECPQCGETENGDDEITWGIKDFADNGEIYQPAHCNKCGCDFKEWYKYDETTYFIEQGEKK